MSVAGCRNDSRAANTGDAGGDAAADADASALREPHDSTDKMDGGPAANAGTASGASGRSTDASAPTVDGGADARAEVNADAGGADDADAGAACGSVDGRYSVLFTEISGTCGPYVNAQVVTFDNAITMRKYVNVDVDTETIVRDCRVVFVEVQRNKATGIQEQRIQGAALQIDADGNVAGKVTLTRYDSAGELLCGGDYDAAFTKLPQ